MTLDDLGPGIAARIVSVDWRGLAVDEVLRLQALGLDNGSDVTVMHRGVFAGRDPLAVQVGRMTVALRRNHARAIGVVTA